VRSRAWPTPSCWPRRPANGSMAKSSGARWSGRSSSWHHRRSTASACTW